jgi:peptide/nickel transport system ATP-binding protein
MASLLEIENLSITFSNSNQKALNNLSCVINKGDTIGLVGESGSGKSITGLALMGLLPGGTKVSGKIWIQNDWIKDLRLSQSSVKNEMLKESYCNLLNLKNSYHANLRGSHLGMIFQEPMTSLNPSMKCGSQVEESLKLHSAIATSERYNKILSLFNEVQLDNPEQIVKKYPHQLSGGQRQRVMIAMALACNPQLLIADEPTTALDVTIQKDILDLLQELKIQRKLSVIFISHDLGVIEKVADKILVLKQGETIEYGNTEQIISHPTQFYTKGLLACKPKPGERPVRLQTVDDFIDGNTISKVLINRATRELTHQKIYQNEPLLMIENIDSWYSSGSNNLLLKKPQLHILKNINLNVWKGETLGLVGESGSGKTTLGRIIMQLVETYSGTILFEGKKISNYNREEQKKFRQKVQLIFQDPYSALSPHQTIGNAIVEPMLVHKLFSRKSECIEKAYELMDLAKIDRDWFKRYPHQLSGGQRQRVVIARALALNPEVIICDESVSALDVSIQAQILNLLNELKEKFNLTYIFISHDLSVVRYMSDRIVVLKDGKIVELAEADELCTNPRDEYTKRLLEASIG